MTKKNQKITTPMVFANSLANRLQTRDEGWIFIEEHNENNGDDGLFHGHEYLLLNN